MPARRSADRILDTLRPPCSGWPATTAACRPTPPSDRTVDVPQRMKVVRAIDNSWFTVGTLPARSP